MKRLLLSAASASACLKICSCIGDSVQAGSVLPASPVSAKAWQRQPPKSTSLNSQLLQGSGIQPVPRERLKASEFCQIQAIERFDRTDKNSRPVMVSAAWQGRILPAGDMLKNWRPQPPMHFFGRNA